MFSPRALALVFCFATLGLATACTPRTPQSNVRTNANAVSNANSSAPKDNIEELESMIRIPFHPEDAIWKEDPEYGPDKKRKLTIVLKFKSDEANKIVESLSKSGPGQPVEIESEDWFSPELVAKSQESGNETVKGTSYAATDFTQSPFTEGRASRIQGTDFFIVELFAK